MREDVPREELYPFEQRFGAALGMHAGAVESFGWKSFEYAGGVFAQSPEESERGGCIGGFVAQVSGPLLLVERDERGAVFGNDLAHAHADHDFGIGNVAHELFDGPLAGAGDEGRFFGGRALKGGCKGGGALPELGESFGVVAHAVYYAG